MRSVYALYDNGAAAERAVRNLRAAGLDDGEITVITAEPMEEYQFDEAGKETWLWYIASGGALVGFTFATWLTRFVELAWPLPTGNMPIVSWWPNMIIMFELTMLGAILATVIALVVAAGLGRRRPALYDSEIMSGKILVGVEHPQDGAVADLERALLVDEHVQLRRI